jgi:endoglycosylceramidase
MGKLNTEYLDQHLAMIKEAIKLDIQIIIDFHQDLFSRYIDPVGDGAPKWVVDGMDLPGKGCGKLIGPKICRAIWGANYIFNKDVKKALKMFWKNEDVRTPQGMIPIQSLFFDFSSRFLTYIKNNLTDEEFKNILGAEPFNEPHYGGAPKRWVTKKWVNNELWPFYKRFRNVMDDIGWSHKMILAEPHVMWASVNAWPLSYPTKLGHLKDIPTGNWVFSPHIYEETREVANLKQPRSGIFFEEYRQAREEARRLGMPTLVTEYGFFPVGKGKLQKRSKDYHRMKKAYYQAMEMTIPHKKSKWANFYAPQVHGTEYAWENFPDTTDPTRLMWGAVGHDEKSRAYPRATQGQLINFFYNDGLRSSYNQKLLEWVGLRPIANGKVHFSKKKFIFMVWKNNGVNAPTEIYLPRSLNLKKSLLLTDKETSKLHFSSLKGSTLSLQKDIGMTNPDMGGNILTIEDQSLGYHFALIVEYGEEDDFNQAELLRLREEISKSIKEQRSILYFVEKLRVEKP